MHWRRATRWARIRLAFATAGEDHDARGHDAGGPVSLLSRVAEFKTGKADDAEKTFNAAVKAKSKGCWLHFCTWAR